MSQVFVVHSRLCAVGRSAGEVAAFELKQELGSLAEVKNVAWTHHQDGKISVTSGFLSLVDRQSVVVVLCSERDTNYISWNLLSRIRKIYGCSIGAWELDRRDDQDGRNVSSAAAHYLIGYSESGARPTLADWVKRELQEKGDAQCPAPQCPAPQSITIPEGFVLVSSDHDGLAVISEDDFEKFEDHGEWIRGTIPICHLCSSCGGLIRDPGQPICQNCDRARLDEAKKIIDANPDLIETLRDLLNAE